MASLVVLLRAVFMPRNVAGEQEQMLKMLLTEHHKLKYVDCMHPLLVK